MSSRSWTPPRPTRRSRSLVLVLDDLQPTGFATLREMASAVDRFRGSGKKVVAWGSSYDQRQYYLAAHADEVYLHPSGTRPHRRLRQPAQLLQGRARQGRHHRQPDPRRHLQELRRALHLERTVAGGDRGGNGARTARCGRPTPTTSRRDASCRTGLDRARTSTTRRRSNRRGRRRLREVRPRRRSWSTASRPATSCARC